MDTNPFSMPPPVPGLAAALAVGLLIGLQRGWRGRDMSEGSRVAGLRTFALVGLLGGVLGSLYENFGVWPLVGGLVGLAVLLAVAYREGVAASGDLSATTSVAALLTFTLGALAAAGEPGPAVGAAVVTAVLLDLKPTLHRWLRMTEHRELSAALQLLVLSLVILPLLPDSGFGPHQALNPYRLWWAVVLIAGLSLTGHFAMRFSGPERGMLWTGVLGGLASSTAATLALARHARAQPALLDATGGRHAGRLWRDVSAHGDDPYSPAARTRSCDRRTAACQRRRAAGARGPPVAAARYHCSSRERRGHGAVRPRHGARLRRIPRRNGAAGSVEQGVVWHCRRVRPGGVAGLGDVDAIVVSLARVHGTDGPPAAAVLLALGLAALANMVTKTTMAWITGGAVLGKRVVTGYAIAAMAGGLIAAASVLA